MNGIGISSDNLIQIYHDLGKRDLLSFCSVNNEIHYLTSNQQTSLWHKLMPKTIIDKYIQTLSPKEIFKKFTVNSELDIIKKIECFANRINFEEANRIQFFFYGATGIAEKAAVDISLNFYRVYASIEEQYLIRDPIIPRFRYSLFKDGDYTLSIKFFCDHLAFPFIITRTDQQKMAAIDFKYHHNFSNFLKGKNYGSPLERGKLLKDYHKHIFSDDLYVQWEEGNKKNTRDITLKAPTKYILRTFDPTLLPAFENHEAFLSLPYMEKEYIPQPGGLNEHSIKHINDLIEYVKSNISETK